MKNKIIKIVLCVLIGIITLILVVFAAFSVGERIIFLDFYRNAERYEKVPGILDGYVAQGYTTVDGEDYRLACGYMANDRPSRIYVLKDGQAAVYAEMKKPDGSNYTGHTGGIDVYGEYDVVVLQDKASNFNADDFKTGGRILMKNSLGESKARRVLYMIWARRDEKDRQAYITDAYTTLGTEIGAAVAPAGEVWHKILRESSEMENLLYRPDGNHATPLGSYLAATTLFYTITGRKRPIVLKEGAEPSTRLDIDLETARRIHKEACAMVCKFREE